MSWIPFYICSFSRHFYAEKKWGSSNLYCQSFFSFAPAKWINAKVMTNLYDSYWNPTVSQKAHIRWQNKLISLAKSQNWQSCYNQQTQLWVTSKDVSHQWKKKTRVRTWLTLRSKPFRNNNLALLICNYSVLKQLHN